MNHTLRTCARTFSVTLVSLTLFSASRLSAVTAEDAFTVKTSKVIDVASMKGLFQKKSRVAIAGYQVAFVTRNKATAHAGNYLGGGSGAKASLETFLGNVDYALMQSIADEAYAAFVTKMEEAGMEVIPLEKVKAAAAYAQLETTAASADKAYKVEFQGAHYVIVAAQGFPLWFNRYDGLAGGKGSSKNVKTMAALAKELDAAVLHPSIAIDFAYLDTTGGNFSKRAGVNAQNGMLLIPAATVYWGSTEGGFAYTKFVDGVWAGGDTGKWVNAEEATNRSLVKGLAGLGIDIGPVSKKKAIVLEANPAVFKEKSVLLLQSASEVYKRGIQEVRR